MRIVDNWIPMVDRLIDGISFFANMFYIDRLWSISLQILQFSVHLMYKFSI